MISKSILVNWNRDIDGSIQLISDSDYDGINYPAYTIKIGNDYGVAVKYDGNNTVAEKFAGARIWTKQLRNKSTDDDECFLLLTTEIESIRDQFSLMCEAFVNPGDDGTKRDALVSNPVEWWRKWKQLLGNKSVDERIYDVLGELCSLLYAYKIYGNAEWNGPFGASYDIETDEDFLEVKSTVNKSKGEITINNQFQLQPAGGKQLKLIRCIFEPCIELGISINSVVNKLTEAGYEESALNERLETRGFEEGMSARDRMFLLQEMLIYDIDDTFPRITPGSFVDGHLPEGIKDISYTVDISSRDAKSIDIINLFG